MNWTISPGKHYEVVGDLLVDIGKHGKLAEALDDLTFMKKMVFADLSELSSSFTTNRVQEMMSHICPSDVLRVCSLLTKSLTRVKKMIDSAHMGDDSVGILERLLASGRPYIFIGNHGED